MAEEARLAVRLAHVARDVRYALRLLGRNPAFSAALALGIGVNAAMFSAVDAVLIRPLPYADADRLVMIWDEMSHIGFPKHQSTPGEWHEWRRSNSVFTDIAATQPEQATLTGMARRNRCRPEKSPGTCGPFLGSGRCSDACSPKTKTCAAPAWQSSAMGSGSVGSAHRPTCSAGRSRSTTLRTK